MYTVNRTDRNAQLNVGRFDCISDAELKFRYNLQRVSVYSQKRTAVHMAASPRGSTG